MFELKNGEKKLRVEGTRKICDLVQKHQLKSTFKLHSSLTKTFTYTTHQDRGNAIILRTEKLKS